MSEAGFGALAWLRLAGACALLLAPGYIVAARVVPAPSRWFAAPFASFALLFAVLLTLHTLAVPLVAPAVAGAMALVTVVLWVACRRRPAGPAGDPWRWDRWWLPALVPLGSALTLSVLNPLSGFDNSFRWDHLARLMLAQQSLASYPPVSAADFELYGWCDGIPPLVSFLNFWIYCLAGAPERILTAARIAGELALVAGGTALLGRRLWGPGAAGVGVAAAAASSLVLWSIGMGQETGLLTAALAGTVYFLLEYQAAPGTRAACWAAVTAAIGALSRDYGLAYVAFAGVVLLGLRARPRDLALFAATAAVIAGPWYLRNAVLTGNPLFPHLAALFPGNEMHTLHSAAIAREWSFFSSPYNPARLPRLFLIIAGIPVLLGLWGLGRAGRPTAILAGAIGLQAALWVWSVPQTAAGWIIAFRVLTPALVLLAALSGWVAGARPALRRVVAVVVIIGGLDASVRLWQFPLQPGRSTLRLPSEPTRETLTTVAVTEQMPLWHQLVQAAHGAGIVVDHPRFHLLVIRAGGRPVPLFSPVLRPTLSPTADFDATVAALRAANLRFICVNFDHGWSQDLAAHHPFWRTLRARGAHVAHPVFAVYDLQQLTLPAASPASR